MDLVCCICAFAGRGKPADAETIIRGYAVCAPHASLVRCEEWTWIQKMARELDPRR